MSAGEHREVSWCSAVDDRTLRNPALQIISI